jgi:hypothetical protein
MARDHRDVLEVLRFELYLLQQGDYRAGSTSGRAQRSYFSDSPTCLNFGGNAGGRPCAECLLADFVPGNYQNETWACHTIPLDGHGNTIASLGRGYNRVAVEKAVLGWLRETVGRLERERQQDQVRYA